jgi:hypothetical protein
MNTTHGPIRTAATTLLSIVTVPSLMLATAVARATQDSSRPWWWFGQPLTQASTPNDLVVCNLLV